MEEEARDGEGNRDRAGEQLSIFGREVLQSRQEEKDPFFSFFFAFSTHTIRIWSQCIFASITLIGQYITATQHTYFNSIIINSFSNMPCSFYLPSFVFFSGFISGSALCNLAPALPSKGRYASRSPLGVNQLSLEIWKCLPAVQPIFIL